MQNQRKVYIDNLRQIVIVLVVMQHISVTYSAVGDWYYTERGNINLAEKIFSFF